MVVVGYGPNEGIGEERERFWNDMERTADRVGNGYRLYVLGDLNGQGESRYNWCFWSSRRKRKWEKSGGVLC